MITVGETFVTSQFMAATNQKLICDFRQARFCGLVGKVWAAITGRSNILMDMDIITQGKSVCSSRYAGAQTVNIQQIKGSEGRCQGFDQNFNPLKTHNQNRWVSIVSAWQRGTSLPAVDLIKIGDVYVIRDGHHRISVARFMGFTFVDAHVTELVLAKRQFSIYDLRYDLRHSRI